MSRITIDEILAVKYLREWEWSPDGKWIAFIWDDGGLADCWITAVERDQEPHRLTQARTGVAGLSWSPQGELAVVVDSDLWTGAPDKKLEQRTTIGSITGAPAWSKDGSAIAVTSDKTLCLIDTANYQLKRCRLPYPMVPGSARWSPGGDYLALAVVDDNKHRRLVICNPQGQLLWLMPASGEQSLGAADWAAENMLVYQKSREMGMVQDFYLLKLPADDEKDSYQQINVVQKVKPEIKHILHVEQSERRGGLWFNRVVPSPCGSKLLFALESDGWLHHYVYELASKQLTQLTFGECEDFGHAGDQADWSPDGRRFAYASNRDSVLERHIWVYDVNAGTQRKVVSLAGTNLLPKWSPQGDRLAFVHCDHRRNMDLWIVDLTDASHPRQLTDSMPAGLAEKLQRQEHITYKGAQDWDIDGFMLKPRDFDPARTYPAIIWLHGGPIRQMRGGWHPSRSYAHFYAFNQYLADQGCVVLTINYRGGIGYGQRFRFGLFHKMGVDDVYDVVAAARYLKRLPYVDADRVAVYGLSYGGYLTLHCLTQYPEEFAMGINIAGIWDFVQWQRWINKRHGRGSMFAIFFGGEPEESPELWAQGSPVTFKENLKRPLINFHGTKDANVDFEQLDRIVADCVKMGKTYEAYYYPGEVHTFAYRHTWQDALPKMLREFDKYLKS